MDFARISSSLLNNRYALTICPQLIVLSFAQLFNHWMDRSLKLFAVYVDADLGISLSTLSYILTFGSYGPVIVFLTSHFYHHFNSNVILFVMEFVGALTMLIVYFFGYKIVWILFVCRLLYSSSIKGIFTYTNTMIAYYVTDSLDITHYSAIFNSAYVVSTFMFVLTGFIMDRNRGLFDYLLIYSCIAFVCSVLLLAMMPRTKTELSTQSQIINLENSFSHKISQLFCNNIQFVLLLAICCLEQLSQSIYNISIGVFVKSNYHADPLQLGLYVTLTQGFAQLIGIACIGFVFGKYLREHHFIFMFGFLEFVVYVVFYVLVRNHMDIEIESCLSIMFLVGLGHMGLYYGLVIVLIKTVPNYQQSVASAIWSVVDIIGASCGTFTVGTIAKHHAKDVELYSTLLLIVYCLCMCCILAWSCKSKDNFTTQKSELEALNRKHESYDSV